MTRCTSEPLSIHDWLTQRTYFSMLRRKSIKDNGILNNGICVFPQFSDPDILWKCHPKLGFWALNVEAFLWRKAYANSKKWNFIAVLPAFWRDLKDIWKWIKIAFWTDKFWRVDAFDMSWPPHDSWDMINLALHGNELEIPTSNYLVSSESDV